MCEKLTEAEREVISEAERKHEVSYIFDDCITNIPLIYEEEDVYEKYKTLQNTALSFLNPVEGKKIVPQKALQNIRDGFDDLLFSMPESTFY